MIGGQLVIAQQAGILNDGHERRLAEGILIRQREPVPIRASAPNNLK
jgi:hypothetical protein